MARRTTQWRGPSRAFRVTFASLPEAGKSTLTKALIPLFKEVNLDVEVLDQDRDDDSDPLVKGLRQWLKTIESWRMQDGEKRAKFHEMASVVFRAVFKINALRAEHSLHNIVVFEHGHYFTYIVERNWARVSELTLREEYRELAEPDLVIFLPVTPQELRSHFTKSHMLLDLDASQRIYDEMLKRAALRENWICIERGPVEAMARLVFGEILCRYREHVEHPKKSKKFKF